MSSKIEISFNHPNTHPPPEILLHKNRPTWRYSDGSSSLPNDVTRFRYLSQFLYLLKTCFFLLSLVFNMYTYPYLNLIYFIIKDSELHLYLWKGFPFIDVLFLENFLHFKSKKHSDAQLRHLNAFLILLSHPFFASRFSSPQMTNRFIVR